MPIVLDDIMLALLIKTGIQLAAKSPEVVRKLVKSGEIKLEDLKILDQETILEEERRKRQQTEEA